MRDVHDYDTCQKLYEEGITYEQLDRRYQAFRGLSLLLNRKAFRIQKDFIFLEPALSQQMKPLTRALVLTKNAAFQFYSDEYEDDLASITNRMEVINGQKPDTYIHYFNLTLKIQICEEMGLLNQALSLQKHTELLLGENNLLKTLQEPTFAITYTGLYLKQMELTKGWAALAYCQEHIADNPPLLQPYHFNMAELLFLSGNHQSNPVRSPAEIILYADN